MHCCCPESRPFGCFHPVLVHGAAAAVIAPVAAPALAITTAAAAAAAPAVATAAAAAAAAAVDHIERITATEGPDPGAGRLVARICMSASSLLPQKLASARKRQEPRGGHKC